MAVTFDVQQAVATLRAGGLAAFPTETVYGLGADARRADAVARVFAVKGRPADHPLIVHLAEGSPLDAWASAVPSSARTLAEAFWPGPLTLILRRAPGVLDAVTGGQETVGLRVPAHPVARALLAEFGGGVAAPSANRFGRVSPTCAQHVVAELGDDVDCILDGGPCEVGVESTIVDCSRGAPALLRPGGITREMLEEVLGGPVPRQHAAAPRVPGQLPSHYAPRARVELVAAEDVPSRVRRLLADGVRIGVLAVERFELPPQVETFALPPELTQAARSLYALLREADGKGVEVLLAVLPAEVGVGLAIADRLRRASAPRAP